ncbi:uncharacterized protein BXZ73DRAFT_39001, partial [Epithele typhae]|uniref:uncharacterized protein n=1 Tax=Epithele typhae TaxID=378194 RepID=UPI002007BD47
GALLIGQMISTFLYGISTLQTYVYLMRFPRDGPELKIWWASDGTTQGSGHRQRHFRCGSVRFLVVAAVVQCFFIQRIHRCKPPTHRCIHPFTRKHTAQAILVIAHIALGAEATAKIISTFQSFRLTSLASLAFSVTMPYTLVAMLSDGFLACTLTILSRGRTPDRDGGVIYSATHQVITLLINRCTLLMCAAIVRFIIFMFLPWTAWFIADEFIMGKLYANSFMACLNARSLVVEAQCTYGNDAVFSTVPDISIVSTGSFVIPTSFTPIPSSAVARQLSRTTSLPEIAFCRNKGRCLIPTVTSPPFGARKICPCMLATRP